MVYIFNEAGETIEDASGNTVFSTQGKAIDWLTNNTRKMVNGDKFIIVDFSDDCSHFYQARMKMTIDLIGEN